LIQARKYRLQAIIFSNLILFLGLKFESPVLRPLNNFVRRVLLLFLPSFLKIILTLRLGFSVHVRLRHSVVEKNAYNIFFSDVDWTLVIPAQLTDGQYKKLRTVLKTVMSIFIFLGEPEVYTSSENQIRLQIKKKYDSFLKNIFALRKYIWMGNNIKNPKLHKYHHVKSYRGRKRIKGDLQEFQMADEIANSVLKQVPAENLKKATVNFLNITQENLVFEGWSGFLEWYLTTDKQKANSSPYLVLSLNQLLALLSILPDGEYIIPPLSESVKILRASQEIKKMFLACVAWELDMCRSVVRLEGEVDEAKREWLAELEAHFDGVTLNF
jgi:hypothetical protein